MEENRLLREALQCLLDAPTDGGKKSVLARFKARKAARALLRDRTIEELIPEAIALEERKR